MRELAALLEAHGVPTEMIRTDRPGYIVDGDEFQITAVLHKNICDFLTRSKLYLRLKSIERSERECDEEVIA